MNYISLAQQSVLSMISALLAKIDICTVNRSTTALYNAVVARHLHCPYIKAARVRVL